MAPIDQGPDARNLEGDAITAVKPEEQKAVDEQASMARKLMLELFDVDPGQHSPGLAAATEAPAIVLHDYVSNDPSRLEAFARRAEQLSHLDGLAQGKVAVVGLPVAGLGGLVQLGPLGRWG